MSRIEDAMEFARGGWEEKAKTSKDVGQQSEPKSKGKKLWKNTTPAQTIQQSGPNVITTFRPPPPVQGTYRGQGSGIPPRPSPYWGQPASHLVDGAPSMPGRKGKGQGKPQKPHLAWVQANEDGTLVLVDLEGPTSEQRADEMETAPSQNQGLGN